MASIEDHLCEQIEQLGLDLDIFLRPEIDDILHAKELSYEIRRLVVEKLRTAERGRCELEREPIAEFTFVDLFSGIGGFRLALESLGGVCIGFSEIDSKAIETYKSNFTTDKEAEFGDVQNISELPVKPDIIVGGVPCQSWSIAGRNRGFDDPRGALWGDVVRLIEINKPKAFIFENVKGLADPRHKKEREYLISSFRNVGYHTHVRVIDSLDHGVVQSRKRIYFVGFRSKEAFQTFTWPRPRKFKKSLSQVLINVSAEARTHSVGAQPNLFQEGAGASTNSTRITEGQYDYFIFNDIRNGAATIHSWDLANTTELEVKVCLKILASRRSSKYGPRDGNPMKLEHITELLPENSDLVAKAVESLIDKKILERVWYDATNGYRLRRREDAASDARVESRIEFANTRISSGIRASDYLEGASRGAPIYRIFMPHCHAFGTITASGSKDFIALHGIDGDGSDEIKKIFVDEIVRKGNYRALTKREFARLQGFPDNFVLHSSESESNKQMGNAVSVPVIRALGKSIIDTGAISQRGSRAA